MADAFPIIVGFTIDAEGSDAITVDAGGVTKFGIAQKYHPNVNVKMLTRPQAVAIYRDEYWAKFGCDKMQPKIGAIYFEMAVNPGIAAAARALQVGLRAMGLYAGLIDSHVGPGTLAALAKVPEGQADRLVQIMSGVRAGYYLGRASGNPTYPRDGLLNRAMAAEWFIHNKL